MPNEYIDPIVARLRQSRGENIARRSNWNWDVPTNLDTIMALNLEEFNTGHGLQDDFYPLLVSQLPTHPIDVSLIDEYTRILNRREKFRIKPTRDEMRPIMKILRTQERENRKIISSARHNQQCDVCGHIFNCPNCDGYSCKNCDGKGYLIRKDSSKSWVPRMNDPRNWPGVFESSVCSTCYGEGLVNHVIYSTRPCEFNYLLNVFLDQYMGVPHTNEHRGIL
jgi:hypothetical protein